MTAVVTTSGLQNPAASTVTVLSSVQWAIAQGTTDQIAASYSPPNTQLIDGMILAFRAIAANVSTAPTFSPDGLVPLTIVKRPGVAVVAGSIPGVGFEALVRYNLANTVWVLMNPAA